MQAKFGFASSIFSATDIQIMAIAIPAVSNSRVIWRIVVAFRLDENNEEKRNSNFEHWEHIRHCCVNLTVVII